MRVLTFLTVLLFSTVAYAADPAPRKAPAFDASNHTGFFVGVAGGYGFNGETQYGIAGIDHDQRGWFGCVDGGFRAQAVNSPLVIGAVLDACYGRVKGDTNPIAGVNISNEIDWFGSARGIVGYSANSPILIYGTFGLGVARAETAINFGPSFSDKSSPIGYAGGLGVEYRLAQNNSLNLEYLRYAFNNEAACIGGSPCIGATYETKMDLVKVGYRKGF